LAAEYSDQPVLNSLINAVTRLIGDPGFPAVLGLMTLESACIPVPSEVIQIFAGYLVSIHRMRLLEAVSAGVLGNLRISGTQRPIVVHLPPLA
jgi:membrane protein DedA with SNARE-associated domain